MNSLLVLLGLYVACDGIVSLYLYRNQSWIEQAMRMIRVLVGAIVIWCGR